MAILLHWIRRHTLCLISFFSFDELFPAFTWVNNAESLAISLFGVNFKSLFILLLHHHPLVVIWMINQQFLLYHLLAVCMVNHQIFVFVFLLLVLYHLDHQINHHRFILQEINYQNYVENASLFSFHPKNLCLELHNHLIVHYIYQKHYHTLYLYLRHYLSFLIF